MIQIISIEFEYRQKIYYALVRTKDWHPAEYGVTIMNGSLEQRLYGHHIFKEENGEFVIEPVPEKTTAELQLAVGMALSKNFNKPCHILEIKT